MKKFLVFFSLFVIFISLGDNSASAAKIDDAKKFITISKSDYVLTQSEKEQVASFGEQLANALKNAEINEYETVISDFSSNNENPLEEKLVRILNDKVEAEIEKNVLKSGEKNVNVEIDQSLKESVTRVYNINEKNILILTPTHIEISQLEEDKNENGIGIQATSTTSGTATHTFYNNFGNRLMSISVTAKFNYNGSKATYHSNFDYWYDRAFLSIWQVSNWRGWREESGTSYQARASGDFHMGLEVGGVGLVIDDVYIRVTLLCDKNGNLYRTHYYN